jgi:hypothetical protein
MAVTSVQAVDVAAVLSAALADVDGLRVYAYVADTTRVPAAVIGQPSVDWQDPVPGFCRASWEFPVLLVVARNNDREAQAELSRLVRDVGNALADHDTTGTGVWAIEPLDARPTVATISGQELPGYNLRILVRA